MEGVSTSLMSSRDIFVHKGGKLSLSSVIDVFETKIKTWNSNVELMTLYIIPHILKIKFKDLENNYFGPKINKLSFCVLSKHNDSLHYMLQMQL